MRLPTIHGVIDRRILLNYRVEPQVLAGNLPSPFRPQVFDGWALAGVCLIRLRDIRMNWLPRICGLCSENAAYRAAVEWDSPTGVQRGVFVWHRVTSSRINALAGSRIFPGVHERQTFRVSESDETYCIQVEDGSSHGFQIDVQASLISPPGTLTPSSFANRATCVCGSSVGYSLTRHGKSFEGLRLEVDHDNAQPMSVARQEIGFFQDEARFPKGTIHFDHALLMRNVPHHWGGAPPLSASQTSKTLQTVCHTRAVGRQ
ncbi:MAG: DUF2071 domain-containing protein [Pirellulales bacterium]|nr:DUF2071 domain-containing protein [Pirellulales bacterium]